MASGDPHSIGISELQRNASRIVRRVRETGEEVAVTIRGEVVAVVAAVGATVRGRHGRSPFTDLDRLSREIGRVWPKGVSASDALRDQRR